MTALAELLDRALETTNEGAGAPSPARHRITYIFGGQLYELRLRRAQRGFERVQQHTTPIVRTAIDIHTLATGARTRFEIVSGTEGSLAGVPISVAWQPRWWLKLRLTLIDGVTSAGRVAEKGGSRTLRGSFDPQPDFEDQ